MSLHLHHRRYATFLDTEMCISTDFSAQYEHKAFCTRTCEHPARSNMDVFIVTHSPRIENGQRVVTTDVWRIFSEAKGSALFHNQALDDIVSYYRERLGLTRVYVFSDGCRSQYKGKKNFQKVATFPSRMHGVELVHRFAASHHFKGPHDAYGKDAKHLCRTAERNGKVRLASTHDVYYFCATKLPRPRRDGVTAEEIVKPLAAAPAPSPLTAEEQAEAAKAAAEALARAPTTEASRRMAKRMAHAGLTPTIEVGAEVPMEVEMEAGEAMRLAEQEAEAEAEVRAEAVAAKGAAAEVAAEAVAAEAAAQEAGHAAVEVAEADAEEDGEHDAFVFDESGARVGAGHTAAEASDEESERVVRVAPPMQDAVEAPPLKKKRQARTRTILTQAPGMEASAEGERRIEIEVPRERGMFTASNYFWLYYAAEGVRGLTKQVGVNEGSGPHGAAAAGEYHAILSNAAAVDADSIAGSNSTYDFSGTDAKRPELLYIRTYSCACERYIEDRIPTQASCKP